MIEKLTPEQEALIPVVRDEAIRWRIEQTNRPIATIQENMRYLYENAGLEPVPVIVCESLKEWVSEVSNFAKESSVWSSVR